MNPNNKTDLERLMGAITHSRRVLSPFRTNRLDALRQFVGSHYSEDGAPDRVPINLIELATNIYKRRLVARNPAALVVSPHPQLKARGDNLGLAVDHLIKEIVLKQTLRWAVTDAIFSLGIVKLGRGIYTRANVKGPTHDEGQPFVDSISLDDWVHDTNAREFESIAFCGNRFRLPHDYVMESDLYTHKGKLAPTTKTVIDEETGDEKAESISRGADSEQDEYTDYVELMDLWLPREQLMITIPVEGEIEKPLRIVEWEGPELGPYHFLRFTDVPDQIMPLAPVATWIDLHMLANRLFKKLGRQGERQKTVTGYRGAAVRDAEALRDADDGEFVLMNDPGGVVEFRTGGPDQVNLALLIQVISEFKTMGGNLDLLGGLSPQSDTLGQDEMLSASASKRLEDMQDSVHDFTGRIIRDLAWYLWTDPHIELPMTKRVAGTDIDVAVTYNEEQKEGDFLSYNFDIHPYSMQYETPGSKLQVIDRVLQNYILPLAPMMAQQGVMINFESLLRLIAKYANMTDLEQIVAFTAPQVEQPGPVMPQQARAPVTKHVNERINRSSGTKRGRDAAMMQTLLGSGVQNSEMATLAPGQS